MTNRIDFLDQANELRQQAENERDKAIRARLQRMAEHYEHLAESGAQNPSADAASLGELFTKRD